MQYRYLCNKCGKAYYKQEGSFSFECKCGGLLSRRKSKLEAKQNEVAKQQLRVLESTKLLRAHDYPHFFGRKTFGNL